MLQLCLSDFKIERNNLQVYKEENNTGRKKNLVDGSERWLFCLINVLSYVRSQVMFQNYDMPISRWCLSVQNLKKSEIYYRCSKNCLSKVAVASPFALRGVCSNCESSGLRKLRSKWKLWVEKEASSNVFMEVANFTNMTGITGNL